MHQPRPSVLVGLLTSALLAAGCTASTDRQDSAPDYEETPLEIYGDVESDMYGDEGDPGASQSGAVNWSEAQSYLGITTEVCGPLVSIVDDDSGTFFNVGRDYPDPDRFSVVVFDQYFDYDSLSEDESYELCVTGQVESYQGAAQVIVNDMSEVYIDPAY